MQLSNVAEGGWTDVEAENTECCRVCAIWQRPLLDEHTCFGPSVMEYQQFLAHTRQDMTSSKKKYIKILSSLPHVLSCP